MIEKFHKIEPWLYVLAVVLALMMRFINLGSIPLSEIEAERALNAVAVAGGNVGTETGFSLYVVLTSGLFYLFSESEFWSRALSAFFGILLVLTPLCLRDWMGRLPAAFFAIFLALDPIHVFAARNAGGDVFAFFFLIATLGFVLSRKFTLAGICFGSGLLSGSGFWYGIFLLILSLLLETIFRVSQPRLADRQFQMTAVKLGNDEWKQILYGLGGTVIILGSLFFFIPKGWNGLWAGFVQFLDGWSQPSVFSIREIFASLLFYEALPIVLGVIAFARVIFRKAGGNRFYYWAILSAVMLVLIYPGRQPEHLMWMLFPLWGFVLKNMLYSYLSFSHEKIPYVAMLILVVIAAIFAWINLSGLYTQTFVDQLQNQLRLASLAGAVLLVLITTILMIWGWNWQTATKALLVGTTLVLLSFYVRASINVIRPELFQQPLRKYQFIDQSLFMDTIRAYQRWNTGFENLDDVYILKVNQNTLKWALRELPDSSYVETLPTTLTPALIVTGGSQQIELTDQFTGQDFVLQRNPEWKTMSLHDWIKWFVTGKVMVEDETVILWVRSDLFPGFEKLVISP